MNDAIKLQAGEDYDLEEGTTYLRAGSGPGAVDIAVCVQASGHFLEVSVALATPKGAGLGDVHTVRALQHKEEGEADDQADR